MAETTGISWTDSTFNPWIGCVKVSPGCTHCYAEKEQFPRVQRSQGRELWGPLASRHVTSANYWLQPPRWDRQAGERGVRRRVFCASLCDVFEALAWNHPDREKIDQARAALFKLIERTPNLDWQLLTKRPDNMNEMAPAAWRGGWPENVWAMTSVENQEYAGRRIPELLKVPARVRGLSVEPMLGPVDLDAVKVGCAHRALTCACSPGADCGHATVSWVIVGGESGPHARPCEVAWVRSLVGQCNTAGVACFVKQLGAAPRWRPADGPCGLWPDHVRFHYETRGEESAHRIGLRDPKGGDMTEWESYLRVRQFPRGSAGVALG